MIRRFLKWFRYESHVPLGSRSAYAKWSQHYPPTPHNLLMEIEQSSMLSLLPPVQGKRVLDLACGTGRYGLLAQSQGAEVILGVDDSFEMLNSSPLMYRVQGDMTQIPLPTACIDLVICGMAVGHHPDLEVILCEMARVLTNDGQAIVSDFHPFQYLAGARRTFNHDGVVYDVEHYPHLYQTLHDACMKAGFVIDAIREPTIEGQSVPVVIVYRLIKHNGMYEY